MKTAEMIDDFFSGARTVNCDQSEDFHTFQLDWTPTELIYSQVLSKCNFPGPNNVKVQKFLDFLVLA